MAVRMKAEEGSDFSRYKVRFDDTVVGDSKLYSKTWKELTYTIRGVDTSIDHEVSIEHLWGREDRTLYVDLIRVNGVEIDAATGVQDVGPQDGKYILTGDSAQVFKYNGVLRIPVPRTVFAGDTVVADDPTPPAPDEPAAEEPTTEEPATEVTATEAYFRPPAPLSKLRVYNVAPSGYQTVTGGPSEDLLLVSPNRPIDGRFHLNVDGFRGIYWIGATFDVAPLGHLITPNGKKVYGVGSVVKIRTHADAVGRPFIYLDRMRFRSRKIVFGDFLQLGGAAKAGDWGDWPDVYRCRMLADPLFGWSSYHGGSFSKNVSHSDFTSFARGGVRHSYAGLMDVTWGYQAEFILPSWASGKKPYKGPDGVGTAQYFDVAIRAASRPSIGATSKPRNFFLARGSKEVEAKDHITYGFNKGGTKGRGVFSVPLGSSGSAFPTIWPGNGSFAPRDHGSYLTWPTPSSGHPFVRGRLENGAVQNVPVMVREADVGYGRRVTNRAGLVEAVQAGCGR